MLRYRDLPTHTTDVLDLTSLTVAEFTALVPAFEAAFLGYMADWTLHGKRRQARRYTTYTNCPLPTPEERLLFILVYLKQNPTQLLHGRLFGMRQSKATQWIHVLLPVLRTTLRTLGDAPCRSVETLRQRLGVEWPLPSLALAESEAVQAAPPAAAPLFVMTAPSDPSRAPKTRLNRKLAIAARKSGTCSKTSC
jgi:Helix-turn-helix of DDE superfamily endonuclease